MTWDNPNEREPQQYVTLKSTTNHHTLKNSKGVEFSHIFPLLITFMDHL